MVWWSVTCPHCQREMPGLIALDKSLKGNPYIMISLNTDSPEMLPAAKAMVKDFGMPRPALLDLGDNDTMPMADFFDVVVTPTVAVIDKSGKMIYAQESGVEMDKLKKIIVESFLDRIAGQALVPRQEKGSASHGCQSFFVFLGFPDCRMPSYAPAAAPVRRPVLGPRGPISPDTGKTAPLFTQHGHPVEAPVRQARVRGISCLSSRPGCRR